MDVKNIKRKNNIVLTPEGITQKLQKIDSEGSPFQFILSEATDALQSLSNVEFESNKLIEQYIQGKTTVEEVMIGTAKLNLAMSMATSIISSTIQTFKEIQQIPL